MRDRSMGSLRSRRVSNRLFPSLTCVSGNTGGTRGRRSAPCPHSPPSAAQESDSSAASLALADWNGVITNAPRTLISLAEAGVLMRLRWQIELLFKLWKSHAQVDAWRTENPARILCEIYAKLLGLIIQQWLFAASSWRDPERSLFKAAALVASMASELASAHGASGRFAAVLERVATTIQRWARTQKRHHPPTTAQRLQSLTVPGK